MATDHGSMCSVRLRHGNFLVVEHLSSPLRSLSRSFLPFSPPSFLPPSLFCRGPLYFLVPLRSLFRLLNVHIPFPSVPDLIAFFPPRFKTDRWLFFNEFRPLTDERFPRLPSENLIIMRMDWNVTFPFASTGTSLPPRPSCERNSTAIGLCSRARVEWKICGITLWITMLERVN